jgi:hypothetical protein
MALRRYFAGAWYSLFDGFVVRVQRKRTKQGYWASNSNQESHDVFYYEGSRQLRFFGSRYPDEYILHVPSASWWQVNMPDWAKDRREIILERLVEELELKKIKKYKIDPDDSQFKSTYS